VARFITVTTDGAAHLVSGQDLRMALSEVTLPRNNSALLESWQHANKFE